MSDSAYQGDAARLEAALDRIVRALDRAAPADAPPDTKALEQGAVAGPGVAPEAGRFVQGPDNVRDALEPAGAGNSSPLVEIGARLDGLIAELRDVLAEGGAPDAKPGTDQPSGSQAPLQSPAARPGAFVN